MKNIEIEKVSLNKGLGGNHASGNFEAYYDDFQLLYFQYIILKNISDNIEKLKNLPKQSYLFDLTEEEKENKKNNDEQKINNLCISYIPSLYTDGIFFEIDNKNNLKNLKFIEIKKGKNISSYDSTFKQIIKILKNDARKKWSGILVTKFEKNFAKSNNLNWNFENYVFPSEKQRNIEFKDFKKNILNFSSLEINKKIIEEYYKLDLKILAHLFALYWQKMEDKYKNIYIETNFEKYFLDFYKEHKEVYKINFIKKNYEFYKDAASLEEAIYSKYENFKNYLQINHCNLFEELIKNEDLNYSIFCSIFRYLKLNESILKNKNKFKMNKKIISKIELMFLKLIIGATWYDEPNDNKKNKPIFSYEKNVKILINFYMEHFEEKND